MSILDNAKEVANAVHEIKNIELYGRVLDLNRGIMDLVEENRTLHAENEDLKRKFKLREQMVFKQPFYYQEGDDTPFCPACWEVQSIAVHLIFVSDNEDAARWDCKSCKQAFINKKDRSVERRHYNPPPPGSHWSR